jgi:uncharacterized protein YhbP (UPF0306 family)
MNMENLQKTILDYMAAHNAMSLATEKEGIPHAASVFYVNREFDIYFLSSPTTRHGTNMTQNPKVSATINEDYANWLLIKGIQMEGKVESIGGIMENIDIARLYVKKFPYVKDFLFSPMKFGSNVAAKVAKVRFYTLKPTRILFLNNELGFGHREELVLSAEPSD